MSFAIRMKVDVVYVGDGLGGMEQAVSAVLSFFPSGASATGLPNTGMGQIVPAPGGNSPTAGNINTAIGNAVTDIEAQIAAQIARIQAFATGGG